MKKKGLSEVVTTLMIILLVLAAIAIVWVVVRNVVQGGADDMDYQVKCLDTFVEITKAEYNSSPANTNYTVRVEMTSGDTKIDGIKLVFTNDELDLSQTTSHAEEIEVLGSKTIIIALDDEFSSNHATKVKVVPFFLSESGKEKLCQESGQISEIEVI